MISELCVQVIERFKALQSHLNTVCEHICQVDQHLPAWYQAPTALKVPDTSLRGQICALLRQVEYLDSQQPREILVGAGIVAASQATIQSLENLNAAKFAFKQAMLKLKAAKVASNHELLVQNFEQLLKQRDSSLAVSLSRMGLARIHLKQCYRTIPFFLQRPNKIAWTWANTRSIKKISVQSAQQLLLKHTQDAGIEQQLKLLQGLDPQEQLAIVQELAPHLRANLVMPNDKQRVMVKGPVPIFYLHAEELPLPEFSPPKTKTGKDKDRMVRNDVKINPAPFLPAIRAHRYFSN